MRAVICAVGLFFLVALEAGTQLWCEGPVPTEPAQRAALSRRINSCVDGNRADCEPIPPSYCHVIYTDVNKCAPMCKNGVWSTAVDGSKFCACQPGYTGKACETEINECEVQPCWNDGTCLDLINQYSCICKPGYTGRDCETGCPVSFGDPLAGSLYHVCKVNLQSWSINRDYCAGLGPFSYLVTIETEAEHQHVAELMESAGCDVVWLGVKADPSGSDSFYWHYYNGSTQLATYLNWYPGDNRNANGLAEDAIVIDRKWAKFQWADVPLDISGFAWWSAKMHCAVCEYPM